jgi:hypothetical protein
MKGALRVSGPLPPPGEGEVDAFIEQLRRRMCHELGVLRGREPQGLAETPK